MEKATDNDVGTGGNHGVHDKVKHGEVHEVEKSNGRHQGEKLIAVKRWRDVARCERQLDLLGTGQA